MIPEDRFMIETDAPYMLPYPRVRGEAERLQQAPRIAAKIAAIRGLTEAGGGADQHRERHPLLLAWRTPARHPDFILSNLVFQHSKDHA